MGTGGVQGYPIEDVWGADRAAPLLTIKNAVTLHPSNPGAQKALVNGSESSGLSSLSLTSSFAINAFPSAPQP